MDKLKRAQAKAHAEAALEAAKKNLVDSDGRLAAVALITKGKDMGIVRLNWQNGEGKAVVMEALARTIQEGKPDYAIIITDCWVREKLEGETDEQFREVVRQANLTGVASLEGAAEAISVAVVSPHFPAFVLGERYKRTDEGKFLFLGNPANPADTFDMRWFNGIYENVITIH